MDLSNLKSGLFGYNKLAVSNYVSRLESESNQKIQDLQNTARKINEAGEKAQEVKETAAAVANTVKTFFVKAVDFFSGLFGRK